jgi:hypothetical protein
MRFIVKRRALLAVAAAIAMTLVWAAPASAATALVVTPNTDLVDFQTVSATGTGFPANTTVVVLQCDATAVDAAGCDLSTAVYPLTDATGSYTTDFVVQRLINTGAGEVDCAPSNCILGSANFDASDPASAPLAFDPNVPPQPRLHIDITVNPTGTFVSKSGVVTVSGTVSCNLPADVFIDVFMQQRVGRVFIQGYAFTEVQCDGTTQWAATGQGFNGIFKGGSAQVDASAYGSNGQQDAFAEVLTTIKLTGQR